MVRWLATLSRYDQLWFCWCCARSQRFQRQSWIRLVSRSGDGYCYALIAFLLSATAPESGGSFSLALAIGFSIEIPLFIAIKRCLKRPRPYQTLSITSVIQAHDQFSFPSGHTTAAFLFAGIASSFYPAWTPIWIIWASMVGISRVLLGVHYPGDIGAGAILGTTLAYLALLFTN
ncbi:phosphatase PAP2 family protein [Pseudidiomarina terrestris]|uniref:phosphatase PAP2 family protein n=1 Tax=Pseudidiomarina terrestris TaxID=2820060 RepID=UPI00265468C3|nr:phosphatase PAP2 family protein [Pseudidiomarina sp. 1ASP75-5]MDN7134934.1 phosphatase PAP2 family protein [Pseudidiomarina sp. 1ASP75-5]